MKKIVFTVTVVLLVIAFGVSAFFVGNYLIEGKQQEDRYDQLAQAVSEAQAATRPTAAPTKDSSTEATTSATEPTMIPGYEELYKENPDTVGWLKIEGTKLNYPVMQTPEDPQFYLYKDFDKKDSKRGCVFAWAAADLNEPSDNITLFGHNMADGTMFAALNSYTNKNTWDRNSLIFFDTLTEYHTYKIFAVFKTSANVGEGFSYHQFVDADNEAEFDEFVKTCKDLAFYDTGITPKYGDKLICLSTCEYSHDNGRLVVAAVRIT